jgi:hypothetical protein
MYEAAHKGFAHRHNPDGSFDSICTQCFHTIATAVAEAEFHVAETTHNCTGFHLIEIMHRTGYDRRPNRSRQPAPIESRH